ncbi:MAG: hypothetical protein HYV61_10220 [Candidatus Rokubacteria bacterium]|nr:hypothetical protein [Candidatus Rokubacteria bacterium]
MSVGTRTTSARSLHLALTLVVGIVLAVPSAAVADPSAALGVERPARPGPAPELALPSLDGKVVRLQDFRGQVVLLGFFTTT